MKPKSRIVVAGGVLCVLVLVISLVSLSHARRGLAASAPRLEEEDTLEFTNNEAEDAYDLHIHWSRAVKVTSVKPFKKKEGSGTSRTDFSNGVVTSTGKASVTVSWDGSTDAKVEEWWWTKKGGDRLGEEKKGNPTAAMSPGPSGAGNASVATANGLHTVRVDTANGRVIVNLPDDMRAGDTISGTVVAEPKGNTSEERKTNEVKLSDLKLNFGSRFPLDKKELMILITPRVIIQDEEGSAAPSPNRANFTTKVPETFDYTIGVNAPRTDTQTVTITINSPVWFIRDQAAENIFRLPEMGQQGRPLEIFGPFDGNVSNTTLRFGPPTSTVQDFEKETENVSGGFGLIRPLAESPRKVVCESPTNVTGPVQIFVNEDGKTSTGPHRNLRLDLSAPKTNLTRGEKTVVTVEVRGLEGIKKDVPLQLDSKGVINMEGGNFQNLRIKPSEVTPEGRYTTNRAITGVQAGGFSVTATVIVRPFDLCLQDDSDPNRLFHFNSFTGDYIFACGGGSCRSGAGGTSGQPPTGSSVPPPPVNLTGTGKMQMKGCIITLTHNAPDRRVFARLDACTKGGEASVETTSPKTNFNITDKNTADNTAASPPK
jgi:hypothetical protein